MFEMPMTYVYALFVLCRSDSHLLSVHKDSYPLLSRLKSGRRKRWRWIGTIKTKIQNKKSIVIFSKDIAKDIKIEIIAKEISKRAKKIQKFIENNLNRNAEAITRRCSVKESS